MKPITLALTILSAAATAAAAAQDGYYDVRSNRFRLIVKSDNKTLDGIALGACHQGAAIEGLCLTGEKVTDPASDYTTYYHSVSSNLNQTAGSVNTSGQLHWILLAATDKVLSTMKLDFDPGSNLANPTFYPGNDRYSLVAFQECGNMFSARYLDDTVSPPVAVETQELQNWYICLTRWSYLYHTLSWKVGTQGEPQNPSCQKVEVVRVWV